MNPSGPSNATSSNPAAVNQARMCGVTSGGRRWRVHTTVAFGAQSDGSTLIVCWMSAPEMLPNTPLARTISAGTAPSYALVSDASAHTTSTPVGAVARTRATFCASSSTSRACTSPARG
jgi:hypothetical protein